MARGKTLHILGNIRKLRILSAPRFREGFTVAVPVPWDRTYNPNYRQVIEKSYPGIAAVNKAFAEVARRTAGMSLTKRMKVIGDALRGKHFAVEKIQA